MEQTKHLTGLTDQEILSSRNKYGNNKLTPPKRDALWKLFLEKFEDPVIRILLIAAFLSLGISFVHQEFAETIGIFCAILLATGVGFWFEVDANKKFDVLNQITEEDPVKVIRNGNIFEIVKCDLVVGDIVLLNTGEEVPADGLLLEAVSLQMDESCLTGEPLISKTTDPKHFNSNATYPSNQVMRGTKVMDGHATMQILKVGDATEYGQVAVKSFEMTGEQTPLNKQLDRLAKFIGVVGFALATLTFTALFVKDLLFGGIHYTPAQFISIAIVLVASIIALIKVWAPLVFDAFELMGKETKLPKSIEEGSWFRWIALGILSAIILSCVGFVFGINPLLRSSWVDINSAGRILNYFMVAVTLVVVAVPEGLPMSVTLSLALSMRRMLKANNLVRKMHACETMGATTVICTDKTGTLTQNQMQVFETQFRNIENQTLHKDINSQLIKESIAVNSTAYLDYTGENIKSLGNPTEAALLLWLHKQDVNYLTLREDTPIVNQLTFSTERKYMATLVDSPFIGERILYVKGAPEIILSLCSKQDLHVEEQLHKYQQKGMRTLGFAYEIIKDTDVRFENGILVNPQLSFLGIVAISDPIRTDVPAAVVICQQAGIDIKIVTGDTPVTAKEIARQIGIWNDSDTPERLITGEEFALLSDEDALQRAPFLKVMCRARPTDKQRLVQLLQQNGHIVAVTGDGTNDAPALNYAHVGLSMGSGTSVAKEASDITLLDDSFSSITSAIMWGRSLYQNIQRFILFQLTINVAALIIVFLGSIFGNELPLTVTQMLWVNLIMDTFAAGALASLPPENKVMQNKPRENNAFIITPAMSFTILFVGLSFVVILLVLLLTFSHNGSISNYNLSRFFTIFVMLQFWNMFNAKAFMTGKSAFCNLKNSGGFFVVAALILLGQFFIVEYGGNVFRTTPLSWIDWLIIIGSTSIVLWIGEVMRLIKKA